MKRFLMVFLSGLFAPALALAALTSLSVQVTPEAALYTQGDTLHVTAQGNGTGMKYRFELFRSATPDLIVTTGWGGARTFDIVTGGIVTPPGDYRLRVTAREVANPDHKLYREKIIRIRDDGQLPQNQMALVQARYETAQQVIRDLLVEVIDRQEDSRYSGANGNAYFSFMSSELMIARLLNKAGELAPHGGPAFVPGAADNATGAIGVEVISPPRAVEDWWGTQVVLHLPAFLDLTEESVSIGYDTVLSPEQEQAQRDLVLARYNLAVATTREALLRIIQKQRYGKDVTDEFVRFQSGDDLINALLNRSNENAPRSGRAFIEGVGLASTGAIGVDVTSAPTAMDNWWETEITIFLPEFLGLTAQSVTISYDALHTETALPAEHELLVARYNFAVARVREALLTVIRRQGAGRDVTYLFNSFSDGSALIDGMLNPGHARAPGGGNAYWVGAAGNENGSIGIDVIQMPAAVSDWWGTAVTISLPAYRGLVAESVTIGYETVLSPTEEQAQRDRVTNRYNLAIRTIRKTFAEVRTALAAGAPAAAQFNALQSGDAVITHLLNAAAIAPRGGSAYLGCCEDMSTGAVGIVVDSPPGSAVDWAGASVSVSLPAFLGLTEQTTVVRFDN